MNRVRYFKCENCNTLIRYLNWNREKEIEINNVKCPHCNSNKLKTLRKRPYYRLKHQMYISSWIKYNDENIVISRGLIK